jgi:S-adenosylmethionine synthetase
MALQNDEPINSTDSHHDDEPFTPFPITDDVYDDFICFHMRNSALVATSVGITGVVKKLGEIWTSLKVQLAKLLRLTVKNIGFQPSLRLMVGQFLIMMEK